MIPSKGAGGMARILLATELGGGLGHVATLLRVAQGLGAAGHACVFALIQPDLVEGLFAGLGFARVRAPAVEYVANTDSLGRHGWSMTDILMEVGFADVPRLGRLLGAWDRVLDAERPDLVVGDFTPGLALACAGRVPMVQVGNGWALPPAVDGDFPLFQPGPRNPESARVIEIVRAVQAARGRPVPASLPEAIGGDRRFVATIPEIDPYRAWRNEPLVGPIQLLPPLAPAPEGPAAFAYLPADPAALDELAAALAALGWPGEAFVQGGPPAGAPARLRLHARPPAYDDALPRARVVVHGGNQGTAVAALFAGRPQVVAPRTIERTLVGRDLRALGTGWAWDGTRPLAEILAEAGRPESLAHAGTVARALHAHWSVAGLVSVVEGCRALLPGAPPPVRAAGARD